jgi:hypothetical protein
VEVVSLHKDEDRRLVEVVIASACFGVGVFVEGGIAVVVGYAEAVH